jgi:hypothetical protein
MGKRLQGGLTTHLREPTSALDLEKRMDFRRVCRPVAVWLFAFAALGCGGERYIVIGTARAPSTSGFVELTDSKQASTRVKIRMEQLHPANSLDPSVHAYVVWFQRGKDKPLRAGALHYIADERVGEVVATSPYRKFVVKITAEANDKPMAPSAFVVASQEVSVPD